MYFDQYLRKEVTNPTNYKRSNKLMSKVTFAAGAVEGFEL